MKKALLFLFAASVVFAAGPKVPYTHEGFYSTDKVQKAVHFVSVDDIKKSLEGKGPINVSFDIDDTLLHSSGYFIYGQHYFQIPGDKRGAVSYLYNQKFWDYVAENGDEHSIPKQSAKDLIKMHLEEETTYFSSQEEQNIQKTKTTLLQNFPKHCKDTLNCQKKFT